MKKLIFISLFIMVSCSTSDDGEEQQMCCGSSIAEIKELIKLNYEKALEEDMSDRQRTLMEEAYQAALDDPCTWEKESLESSGATCNGPH